MPVNTAYAECVIFVTFELPSQLQYCHCNRRVNMYFYQALSQIYHVNITGSFMFFFVITFNPFYTGTGVISAYSYCLNFPSYCICRTLDLFFLALT